MYDCQHIVNRFCEVLRIEAEEGLTGCVFYVRKCNLQLV
jgi:hypothetical protein